MASSLEFVQYAAEQLSDAGEIHYKKMFGEYGIYCNGKYFAMVCDDQLLIKITEEGREVWPGLDEVPPYENAKPAFLIEDVENREMLTRLATATCKALPIPKPKKPKEI